jgi:hypothetical protein
VSWSVPLKLTDCSNGGAIGGAWISDGTNTYNMGQFGLFTAVVNDDEAEEYGFLITHSAYLNLNVRLRKSMEGQQQSVCMTPAGPGTGTSDGW